MSLLQCCQVVDQHDCLLRLVGLDGLQIVDWYAFGRLFSLLLWLTRNSLWIRIICDSLKHFDHWQCRFIVQVANCYTRVVATDSMVQQGWRSGESVFRLVFHSTNPSLPTTNPSLSLFLRGGQDVSFFNASTMCCTRDKFQKLHATKHWR